MKKTLLNIASGKMLPLDLLNINKRTFLVNIDTMYYQHTPPDSIEVAWAEFLHNNDIKSLIYYCKEDIYTFIEKTKMIFDNIYIYRFLEHISMDKILYFIYLLSTVTCQDSEIDIIVPNYKILSQMLLDEKIDNNFDANNILLTTELLNQSPDPHASIWTPERAYYFFELENRFKVKILDENFEFDGRNIYLRFLAKRV